jgi:hypothetical protein
MVKNKNSRIPYPAGPLLPKHIFENVNLKASLELKTSLIRPYYELHIYPMK